MERKFKRIETDRLIIDYGTIDDYVKIHEYDFNDLQNIDGITQFTKLDPEEVRKWFGNNIDLWYEQIESKNHYNMVVFLKDTNEPIADIGFDRNDPTLNSIEVSVWLHPNYWGNGYIKEAMVEIMNFIFNQGFDNIIAGYVDGNFRSMKLQESLGFIHHKINENFSTNYGLKKEYINVMGKERFNELYSIDKIKK